MQFGGRAISAIKCKILIDYSSGLHNAFFRNNTSLLEVEKCEGAVAYPDEVLTDLNKDLTNTSGSTNIISGGNTHPYLESTAARAVLETATGPNTKKHVEKILDALCSEPKNEPSAVQIYGVLLMIEEHEEELKKRDKEIEKRDTEIEKRDKEIEKRDTKIEKRDPVFFYI
ncbi:unnamed protein product [Mytilus coruscus]|uniref:Uncharacterized protein n=1 Tax=Mytilus coruscus TaxID=42192 RepID=A0A6J8AAW8_MYTCO|nr:unnamed protein product [Mytilus coruscus]